MGALGAGARMGRQIDLSELRAIDVGVDLRGGDVRMPQYLLEHAQIRPAGEHVGRKRVAERMWVQPLYTYGAPVPLAKRVYRLTRETPAVLVEKDRRGRGGAAGVVGELGTGPVEIGDERAARRPHQGDEPLLGPLAKDPHKALVKIEVAYVE